MMIDMAIRYDEYPPEDSEFGYMRDSLYILCIMNQCKLKSRAGPVLIIC